MSAVLAKSTVTDRYAKSEASSRRKLNPSYDIAHVREKFKDARPEEWLIERLGKAITKRRQYLIYCQCHREKLAHPSQLQRNTQISRDGATEMRSQSQRKSVQETRHTRPSAIQTTASSLGPVDLGLVDDGFDDTRSYSTMATSVGSSDPYALPVPPLTSVGTPGEHFECPYCRTVQRFNGQLSWRKHVFADIRPYLCTFPDCGMLMFDSKRAWAEHELQNHRRIWTCQICKRRDFCNSDTLELHLKHAHCTAKGVCKTGSIVLPDSQQMEVILAAECPLCDLDSALRPGNVHVSQNSKITVTIRQFMNHMAKHLEHLALFSLPKDFVDGSNASSARAACLSRSDKSSEDMVELSQCTAVTIILTYLQSSDQSTNSSEESAEADILDENEERKQPLTAENFAELKFLSAEQVDVQSEVSRYVDTLEPLLDNDPLHLDSHIDLGRSTAAQFDQMLEEFDLEPYKGVPGLDTPLLETVREASWEVNYGPDSRLSGVGENDFSTTDALLADFPKFPPANQSNDLSVPVATETADSFPMSDPSQPGFVASSGPNLPTVDSNSILCPEPKCGRLFPDLKVLKAHMLTHQNERPEKCPIPSCEYHTKGFARKYDKNRHTLTHYKGTMVCGFCPGEASAAEKSFNRADVFKRHLTSVHGVEQTPNARRKGPARIPSGSRELSGMCSTCGIRFENAQDFYGHLDDCVLRIVQQAETGQETAQRNPGPVSAPFTATQSAPAALALTPTSSRPTPHPLGQRISCFSENPGADSSPDLNAVSSVLLGHNVPARSQSSQLVPPPDYLRNLAEEQERALKAAQATANLDYESSRSMATHMLPNSANAVVGNLPANPTSDQNRKEDYPPLWDMSQDGTRMGTHEAQAMPQQGYMGYLPPMPLTDTIENSPILRRHAVQVPEGSANHLPAIQPSPTQDPGADFARLPPIEHLAGMLPKPREIAVTPGHGPHSSISPQDTSHLSSETSASHSPNMAYGLHSLPTQYNPAEYYSTRKPTTAIEDGSPLHTWSQPGHAGPLPPNVYLRFSPGPPENGYKCAYPGCTAAPFQALHLLRCVCALFPCHNSPCNRSNRSKFPSNRTRVDPALHLLRKGLSSKRGWKGL
jgi:hypothetical protein